MNDIQTKIDKIKQNNFTNDELIQYLDSNAILVRLNSILAVVRLKNTSDDILDKLSDIASRINEESRVFGVWNNAHFAIAALKLLDTTKSLERFENAILQLDITTKVDIERLIAHFQEII